MIWVTTALAGLEPSAGAFLGLHLAGKEHELYQVPGIEHQPMGPSIPIGLRASLKIAGPLHAEGELMAGPAPKVAGMLYGWRAHAVLRANPIGRFAPLFLAGGGNLGLASRDLGHDLDVAGHLGPALEMKLRGLWWLRADLRYQFSARKGSANLPGSHGELLIGVLWRAGERDRDNDGLIDRLDACPTEKEVFNGYRDEDGCPDELASLIVTVKDAEGRELRGLTVTNEGQPFGKTDMAGSLPMRDLMPDTRLVLAADTPQLEPDEETIVLREGENRVDLELGWVAGTLVVVARAPSGSPLPADVRALGLEERTWTLGPDGTSTQVLPPGEWRLLVSEEGYDTVMQKVTLPDRTGARTRVEVVLPKEVVQVQKDNIVILEKIHFEFDSSVVQKRSYAIVDAVAAALQENPDILRVEVGGHASEEGTAKYNLDLSQARVDEVLRLLVARGVDPKRLSAKGYGETRPIAPNDTEEGRSKNRRVEFKILERAEGVQQ